MINAKLTISNSKNKKDLSERLLDFVVNVIKIADMLPNKVSGRHVAGQLIRAGTSSGSNCEEACGAESRSDFVHKMSIVLKELKEARFWLRVIQRTGMLSISDTGPAIIDEGEQLCAIAGKSIITAKDRKKKG